MKIRSRVRMERVIARQISSILTRQAKKAQAVFRKTGDLRVTLATVDAYDEKLEGYLRSHYIRVGEREARDIFDAVDVKKSSAISPSCKNPFQKIARKEPMILERGRILIERKRIVDRWRQAYLKWVKNYGADNVVNIQTTTKNRIKLAITRSREAGLSNYDIGNRIYDRISGVGNITAKVRSRMIARTETHFAAGVATFEAAEQAPFEMEKEWIPAEDERTRPDHADASLIGYANRIPQNEAFYVGGSELMHPGDPGGPPEQVINCRCVIGWHTGVATVDPPKPRKALHLVFRAQEEIQIKIADMAERVAA